MTLEVCVDSMTSCVAALAGGADRLELCSALPLGGLTPSDGLLKMVKRRFPKSVVYVMIRPRAGDFVYGEDEILQMELEIESLKASGADGFVFGLLTSDGHVDSANCQRLVKLCGPLPVTFHRAFDVCAYWPRALSEIRAAGFSRVLTSGQSKSAYEGRAQIREIQGVMKDWRDFRLIAGCGVTAKNIGKIVEDTGVDEIHASAKMKVTSKMTRRHSSVSIGHGTQNDDDAIFVTAAGTVAALKNALKSLSIPL